MYLCAEELRASLEPHKSLEELRTTEKSKQADKDATPNRYRILARNSA